MSTTTLPTEHPTQSTQSTHQRKQAKRAAAAAYLGGMLEYYDYFIYASAAALVFGRIFFPEAGGAATLASLATFGVAYVARPFGAMILGHFGDKVGRKNVLVFTLVLMGGSTFLIGCLPDFNTIGIWAPILLVVLRICQGLSAGGETAGASTLTIEQAPAARRGLYGSWALNGIVSGLILASLVFLPIAALPEKELLSWGWRRPVLVLPAGAGPRLRHPPHPGRTRDLRGDQGAPRDCQASACHRDEGPRLGCGPGWLRFLVHGGQHRRHGFCPVVRHPVRGPPHSVNALGDHPAPTLPRCSPSPSLPCSPTGSVASRSS